jgi:hypothetical protein
MLDLDRDALRQASGMLNGLIDQQRSHLVSEVTVLADDSRIRATVLGANFDEPTVRDVLQDLRKSSGASVLAVLDSGGKIRAVAGADTLRDVNLGSSPVVNAAQERVSTDVWTLPDQVRVIAVAPIRSGDRVLALLMKGVTLGEQQLGAIQRTLGVTGAIFIGERMTASGSTDPSLAAAFQAASRIGDENDQIVESGGRNFLGRAIRTSGATRAGRIIWLVPLHRGTAQARTLEILACAPVVPAGMLLVALLLGTRRTNGGIS